MQVVYDGWVDGCIHDAFIYDGMHAVYEAGLWLCMRCIIVMRFAMVVFLFMVACMGVRYVVVALGMGTYCVAYRYTLHRGQCD